MVKAKLWDKPKNIELLMKHLGMLLDRVEHSTNKETLGLMMAELEAGRHRSRERK